MGKSCPKHGQALISSQDTVLPASLQERHFEMVPKTATYPSWSGCKDQLLEGEEHSLGVTGNSQDSNTVKMFEFSSVHFPLVVFPFLFIYREIKSIMGNSKANRKHFSWVCLSWQHNNNCNNLTTALGVSENESSLHS